MAANSSCSSQKAPSASQYLPQLDLVNVVIVSLAAVLVLVTTVIFLVETVVIIRRRTTWPQPGKTLWLLGLYMVFGWTSLVGVLVPRSGDLGEMIATMYLSSGLYIFKRLMVNYYGGWRRMVERLGTASFSLRGPPCCCCCICLPKVAVSPRSACVVEVLVLQYAIVQPILVYSQAVVMADLQGASSDVGLTMSTVSTISSLLALYGLFMFYQVSHQHLAYASVTAKFVCLKLIVGLNSLQTLLLSVLADYNVIPCSGLLSNTDNAARIRRYLIVVEAFLISLLAAFYYKQDEDLHIRQGYLDHAHTGHDEGYLDHAHTGHDEVASLSYSGSTQSPPTPRITTSNKNYGATDTTTDISPLLPTKQDL